MRWFWNILIAPLLEALAPEIVVEIGSESGEVTRKLLDWAASCGALIHCIDPAPKFDPKQLAGEQIDLLRMHESLSLRVLPEIDGVDLALIDGDHNWYTVHSELQILERSALDSKRLPPVILLHDVGWPYGRRDLYYDPESIPAEHRQPHAKRGIVPGEADLKQSGINEHLDNALREGGTANGVLTAIEDFLSQSKVDWRTFKIPGLHGLAVLAPIQTLDSNQPAKKLMARTSRADFLRAHCEAIEAERIETEIRRIKIAGQLTATRAQLKDAEQQVELLGGELSEKASDAERRDRLEQHLRSEIDALSGQIDAQTAEMKEQNAQFESLSTELQRVRANSTQETSHDKVAEDPRGRGTDEAHLRLELQTAAEELAREASELIDVRAELSRAKRQYQHIVSQLRESEAEREELEQTVDQSRGALRDTRRRLREATTETESERDAREHAVQAQANLKASLDALREERRGELAELSRSRDELETLRTELTNLQRLRTEDHNLLDESNAVSLRAKRELASAHQDLEAKAHETTELERQLQVAQERTRRLQEDVDGLRETLQAELDQTRAETHRARLTEEDMKRELAQLQTELELSSGQRQRLQSALARARAEAELARAENEALDRRAAELSTQTQITPANGVRPGEWHSPGPGFLEVSSSPGQARAISTEAHRSLSLGLPAAPPLPGPPRDPLGKDVGRQAPDESDRGWPALAEPELEAQEAFLEKYGQATSTSSATGGRENHFGLPWPADRRGVLSASGTDQQSGEPTVDVIVCVHNALEDVRTCLWSLLAKTTRRFHLIVVNDGSDQQTSEFLEHLASEEPAIELIHQADPPHGYTIAANIGLRASTSDYVVLLNSDTIVSQGWLRRLVSYGERHPKVGILGPLSNAASHQSVPELRHRGEWATNPLPDWLTIDGLAVILDRAAPRTDSRLPFINGFCYAIKRETIEKIGYFDEEHFASGYCEENDFSYRAGQAGFELAVVDDAYVYHAKSKSFGVQGRKELAKRNYQVFLDKHDSSDIKRLVEEMEHNSTLAPVRTAVSDAISSPAGIAAAISHLGHKPLSIVFVLPGLGDGGSGGSHSIYQEVQGMRRLGIPARIALFHKARDRAWAAYDDAADVFELFSDEQDLLERTEDADVISATHFKSVAQVAALRRHRENFLPAYYVQDYEPFFMPPDGPDSQEAADSYTAVADMFLFAKTHWLCNIVGNRHGVPVAKVEPSIDELLYRAPQPTPRGERVRIASMIRPRTPRRQPFSTVALLERLVSDLRDEVEVVTFGCHQHELEKITRSETILGRHAGLLKREEVANLLSKSDVFLDMSMYQAFGRTALEAMACGCTAVMPNIGGVEEFAEHDQNAILVDTFDREAAYRALTSLVTDHDYLEALKRRAHQTASRYSIVRAALSEYLTLEYEYRIRFG